MKFFIKYYSSIYKLTLFLTASSVKDSAWAFVTSAGPKAVT